MPHVNEARKILNSHETCSLEYVTKGGEWVVANNVQCTSTFHQGNTANIKFQDSEEFRTIRVVLIMTINGMEVYL